MISQRSTIVPFYESADCVSPFCPGLLPYQTQFLFHPHWLHLPTARTMLSLIFERQIPVTFYHTPYWYDTSPRSRSPTSIFSSVTRPFETELRPPMATRTGLLMPDIPPQRWVSNLSPTRPRSPPDLPHRQDAKDTQAGVSDPLARGRPVVDSGVPGCRRYDRVLGVPGGINYSESCGVSEMDDTPMTSLLSCTSHQCQAVDPRNAKCTVSVDTATQCQDVSMS